MRGATCNGRTIWPHAEFLSTLPMRGATRVSWSQSMFRAISIHAPHAGSDIKGIYRLRRDGTISIHAPHAGSDCKSGGKRDIAAISIHAPHAGSDPTTQSKISAMQISIHAPHAGSDPSPGLTPGGQCPYFYPRSPCGERLPRAWLGEVFLAISIHAPHAGSDAGASGLTRLFMQFLSTLPMRGATAKLHKYTKRNIDGIDK